MRLVIQWRLTGKRSLVTVT